MANARVDFPDPGGPAIMDTSPLRMEIDLSDHDLNGIGMAMPPRLTLCIALSKDLMCPPSGLE
jgi:hypothetical protein